MERVLGELPDGTFLGGQRRALAETVCRLGPGREDQPLALIVVEC
jgi:hypothetical protein